MLIYGPFIGQWLDKCLLFHFLLHDEKCIHIMGCIFILRTPFLHGYYLLLSYNDQYTEYMACLNVVEERF